MISTNSKIDKLKDFANFDGKLLDHTDPLHKKMYSLAWITMSDLDAIRARLTTLMVSVSRDLGTVIDGMEHNNWNYSPNSLGILQNSGSGIDRLCGEYNLAKKHAERIVDFIESVLDLEAKDEEN